MDLFTFKAMVYSLIALSGCIYPRISRAQTTTPSTVRVAVFAQNDFPRYGATSLLAPRQIADDLKAVGLDAELLDAATLAQPERFNAKRYAAVILPYGNTYPLEAFANLRRFHQAGGSLVTTGIPFTHAAARRSARNWEPTPSWGSSVQMIPGAGPRPGTNAIQVDVGEERWTGISSSRFPVHAGDAVTLSLSLRETTPARRRTSQGEGRADHLYVRFYDATGKFLEQKGASLTAATPSWQTFTANETAPATATAADLSVQMQRTSRRFRLADFTARVSKKAVSLANADLSVFGDGFLDLGHSDTTALWGPDGIGVGGFAGPAPSGQTVPALLAPGDPFQLTGIVTPNPQPQPAPQWLAPATVPKGVQIVPAIGDARHPLAALVIHTGDAFKGAVDAWTYRTFAGDREEYETRQTITHGTVAALTQRGLLNKTRSAEVFRRLAALPSPRVYANITLPTPTRGYTTFQPKMPPPARHLVVADVRKLSPDEKLLLISLQGIVNRKQPRIYLLFDNDDQRWLEELQKQGATDAPEFIKDPFSLVERFRDEYKGAVVCDPKVYDSACVAVSMAGADDLIVARTAALAARVKVPVKADLRGKFKDNAEALRYIHTDLLPRLDPYLTCSLDPAVYDAGGLDQIIAARGSAFWITGPRAQTLPGATQAREMEELRAMFAKMPLGAIVRGFWWHGDEIGLQETDGVALGSRFGKPTLVSDLITNLSVHSGVPATRLVQKKGLPAPPYDPKKVYVCFTMSDGDNLCTWRGYFRRYFDDPLRGTFPIGWGMSPAILDLAPDWARWYYEKATPNDEFICDVSGVAYIYPPSWGTALKDRDGAFRYFYTQTQDYMDRMNMKTIRLMDVAAPDIAKVGPLLPKLDFLMPDYGRAEPTRYSELTYSLPSGQAIFRAATNGRGPQNLADQIRTRTGPSRPAFVNAFIWNWGSSIADLKKVLELLGPEYVAVTPSQLNELYKKSKEAKELTLQ